MSKSKIRVLIVDDSQVARDLLAFILQADPEIQVIGFAKNGEEALNWLRAQTADVIIMDLFMPALDGFETARRIMETNPLPILIISSSYSQTDIQKSFQAFEAGALAILEKPYNIQDTLHIRELLDTIHIINGTKLVKRRPTILKAKVPPNLPRLDQAEISNLHTHSIKAIAIGASLGGPVAVEKILSALPASMPAPIFLVQHISQGFTKGFAEWLQKTSALRIKLGEQGELAMPDTVYIAPDGCHMMIKENYSIALDYKDKSHLKPGISQLFTSIATTYGPQSVGVLLTGMGRDGADGLLKMRQRGACTIVQDEKSCVMFGMPKEAIELGAARYILPLDRIAKMLLSLSLAHCKD